MSVTSFRDVSAQITESDIRDVEREVGVKFPSAVVRHYLEFNGGTPEEAFLDNGEVEVSVSQFLPIRHGRGDGRTLDSTHRRMVDQGVIDPDVVPFAVDWGSNFFCFDDAGRIYYCTTDSWRDGSTPAENRARARRQIADSFYAFVERLEPDPE